MRIKSDRLIVRYLKNQMAMPGQLFCFSIMLQGYLVISLVMMRAVVDDTTYTCTEICQIVMKAVTPRNTVLDFGTELRFRREEYRVYSILATILTGLSLLGFVRLVAQPDGSISGQQLTQENEHLFSPPVRVKTPHQLLAYNTLKDQLNTSCKYCKNYEIPHAMHVDMADQCYNYYDHTCPWVGRNISCANMRYFIIYLLITAADAYVILAFEMSVLIRQLRFILRNVLNGQGDRLKTFYIIPASIARTSNAQVALLGMMVLSVIVLVPITLQLIAQAISLGHYATYNRVGYIDYLKEKYKSGDCGFYLPMRQLVNGTYIDCNEENRYYILKKEQIATLQDVDGNPCTIMGANANVEHCLKLQDGSQYIVHIIDRKKGLDIFKAFPWRCSMLQKWKWYRQMSAHYAATDVGDKKQSE